MSRRRTSDTGAPSASDHPGAAFVAVTRLTLKDGTVVAVPGERCDRVPAISIPSLAQRGKIRPLTVSEGAARGEA